MKKRLLVVLILSALLLGALPSGFAEDWVSVDKVNIETYPGPGMGNDLPTVGQQVSTFFASTITQGISVTGWSLVNDAGAVCTGTVENENYTMNVTVTSDIVNYYFTSSTRAFINNVAASIVPSEDGRSAVVSRYIKPNVIDPVIYKNPTDETHPKSSVFSFTASASQVFTTFQWIIMSTYGEKFTPEQLAAAFPGVQAIVSNQGGGAVRLNIYNPVDGMNGWLVYCEFTGYTGTPVATSKAMITITDAEKTPVTPAPTPTVVDGVTVPEGITIVDEPTPEVTATPEVVSTPAPTAAVPTPEPADTPAPAEEEGMLGRIKDSKALQVLKWIGIVVGALFLSAAVVLFIAYLSEKNKKKRRKKMSGRGKENR